MELDDRELIKILNIHARALKKLDLMARDLVEEIYNEKLLVANLYKEIKKGLETKIEIESDNPNVIKFPLKE